MDVKFFLDGMQRLGVNKYYGVPDSQLKALCDTLYETYGVGTDHIVAANEGGATALAAGHYLATGKPALVYMQNSGIGNMVNPSVSLLDQAVYGIPCVFVVGWRGEPGIKDEPQHKFQGEITIPLLDMVGISNYTLSEDTSNEVFNNWLNDASNLINQGKSVAFIIRKNALTSANEAKYQNSHSMSRETAIEAIIENSQKNDVFVSTTGKASRELFEIREKRNEGHEKDFLTVGSMGHASMIALGIALEKPDMRVWCIDGDGAMVMHLGSSLVLAKTKCTNLVHVVLNNGAHETVGGMPVAKGQADFSSIAGALGYAACYRIYDPDDLKRCIAGLDSKKGPVIIEVMAALGARKDLGRPTTTPKENKSAFMHFLSIGVQE